STRSLRHFLVREQWPGQHRALRLLPGLLFLVKRVPVHSFSLELLALACVQQSCSYCRHPMASITYAVVMRSVRLGSIIVQRARVPSPSVSALGPRFEASERTVQRDISAMADLGAPRWTRPGPAG